jgi:hypothetical protein
LFCFFSARRGCSRQRMWWRKKLCWGATKTSTMPVMSLRGRVPKLQTWLSSSIGRDSTARGRGFKRHSTASRPWIEVGFSIPGTRVDRWGPFTCDGLGGVGNTLRQALNAPRNITGTYNGSTAEVEKLLYPNGMQTLFDYEGNTRDRRMGVSRESFCAERVRGTSIEAERWA